ncbi:MAG: hypothetical protein PHP01_04565 [Phycisphaerae bacterium]|nr:hypothetical protein [Phycisphaerae bacterium]
MNFTEHTKPPVLTLAGHSDTNRAANACPSEASGEGGLMSSS